MQMSIIKIQILLVQKIISITSKNGCYIELDAKIL